MTRIRDGDIEKGGIRNGFLLLDKSFCSTCPSREYGLFIALDLIVFQKYQKKNSTEFQKERNDLSSTGNSNRFLLYRKGLS